MHHTGKVLDTKLGFVAVFRRDVVGVELVLRVELVQHRSISSLLKDKGTGIHYKEQLHKTVNYIIATNVIISKAEILQLIL